MDLKLLEELCLANGVSGDEEQVRKIIFSAVSPYADHIETDAMGNLLVFKKGERSPKRKLMLSAHMDEVGFIVIDITTDGMLKVEQVGGIDRRVICGKAVTVGESKVKGVFGIKPVHLSGTEEKEKIPSMEKMYVDIGAESREQALCFVNVGDYVVFDTPFLCRDGRIFAKALDDRAGCLVLIEMLKQRLAYDMHFSFLVQEEVGLRGAAAAAYTVEPYAGIVVESTTAADTAGVDSSRQVCRLGEGAVVSFMDRRTIYDKDYYKLALHCGQHTGVKVQLKQAVTGGNDAGAIHCSRGGVRTIAISLPCRYIHSGTSIITVEDLEAVYQTVFLTAEKIAGDETV